MSRIQQEIAALERCIGGPTWKRIQETYVAEKVKARDSMPMRIPSSSATPASPSHATLRFSSHRPKANAMANNMHCSKRHSSRRGHLRGIF